MNILQDAFPVTIKIDGEDIPVQTDFRIMARIETILRKTNFEDKKAVSAALLTSIKLFYVNIPHDLSAAIDGLFRFYRCGIKLPKDTANSAKSAGRQKRYYSFEEDGEYLYAFFCSSTTLICFPIKFIGGVSAACFRDLRTKRKWIRHRGQRGRT